MYRWLKLYMKRVTSGIKQQWGRMTSGCKLPPPPPAPTPLLGSALPCGPGRSWQVCPDPACTHGCTCLCCRRQTYCCSASPRREPALWERREAESCNELLPVAVWLAVPISIILYNQKALQTFTVWNLASFVIFVFFVKLNRLLTNTLLKCMRAVQMEAIRMFIYMRSLENFTYWILKQ